MSNVHAVDRPLTVQDHLAKARRAADIGDNSHTVFYAQKAVCLALQELGAEIAGLRRELVSRNVRA